MNEFVDRINVSMEDMEYTGKNGYVKGMCNVLIKHLDELEETERPIHCTDKRRLKFFVKTDGEWRRDEGNTSITNMMNCVTNKHIDQLQIWKKLYPDWLVDQALSDTFLEITGSVFECAHAEKGPRNMYKVMQTISEATGIKSRKGIRED